MEDILKNINDYSQEQIEGFIDDGIINVQEVVDTLQEYDAVQIARFIKKGLIQLEDVENNYDVDIKTRKTVKKMLESNEEEEPIEDDDSCFEKAKEKNTIPAYDEYLTKFPEGDHRQEAKELKKKLEKPAPSEGGEIPHSSPNPWKKYEKPIDVIIKEKSRTVISDLQFVRELEDFLKTGRLSKQQLLDLIKEDNNLFNRGVIKDLVSKGWLLPDELIQAGIGDDFIYALYNITEGPQIDPADNPTTIVNRSTEVYFWGIPSSGKSCVMAALMSVLKSGKEDDIGRWEPTECKGSDYMNRLSMLYKENEVKVLLPGTPVASTYEMAFNLTRLEGPNPRRKKPYVHPFTFIDLAGGILFLMYDYLNKRNNMTDENKAYLKAIEELIIGTSNDKKMETNRKMHCFVIEYGAETWRYNGYDQLIYLGEALRYIEETNIFKNKATDSIYVIVTKSDRANLHGEKLNDEIENYVRNGYYKGFYDRLKGIAEKCEINGGKVPIVPFTIGEVKMRSLCKFNGKPARVLIEKLAERSVGFDESKWGKIKGGMKQ